MIPIAFFILSPYPFLLLKKPIAVVLSILKIVLTSCSPLESAAKKIIASNGAISIIPYTEPIKITNNNACSGWINTFTKNSFIHVLNACA